VTRSLSRENKTNKDPALTNIKLPSKFH